MPVITAVWHGLVIRRQGIRVHGADGHVGDDGMVVWNGKDA
jgi:hypothetical protein